METHWQFRNWMRFRLRTLLAAVTFACVVLTIFTMVVQPAKRSRLLLERLEKQQRVGFALFEQREIWGVSADRVALWPRIAKWLDEPFLVQRVSHMNFEGQDVTDKELADLAGSLPCENLSLRHSRLTDVGMGHLARMSGLKSLWLCDLSVSADGLARLADAEHLTKLLIKGNGVTDATLGRISELNSVCEIQLVDTAMTEKGLQHVAKMPQLTYLFISSSKLTDAQVDVIAKMHHLERLDLCGVGWNDARMAKLDGLQNLTHLMVYNNPITIKGLAPLEGLKQLEWLDVRSTRISDEGVDALAKLKGLKGLHFDAANKLSAAAKKRMKEALPECAMSFVSDGDRSKAPFRRYW